DHIDHNKQNCTRLNLRFVTQQQNLMNRRLFKNSSTGAKGVTFQNGKWHARIELNERAIHLAHVDDPKTAALIYDAAASRLFGVYAVLNFPDCPTPPE